MRKTFVLLLLLIIAIAGFCLAYYSLPFYPVYSIIGSVNDSPDGKSANGYQVYFYQTIGDYNKGFYSFDKVGPGGSAALTNRFIINTYSLGLNSLSVGNTYFVGIPNDNPADPANGYGADPIAVTISGSGADVLPVPLQLKRGSGTSLPPPPPPVGLAEPAPQINIWFGGRLYQPAIYGLKSDGKKPFIVSEDGDIKIEVNIADPFQLEEKKSYALSVKDPAGSVKSYDLSTIAGVRASAIGYKPLVIESPYPDKLKAIGDESVYTFVVNASSKGTIGLPTAVSTQAAVTVLGGPVRLVGEPLTFPSPFSITKDKTVYIQYTLSSNANMEIYIISVRGERVKHFICPAGTEGGTAGLNKIPWDGMTDQGYLAGNAIYVGTILTRDDARLLGKVKLTIVD